MKMVLILMIGLMVFLSISLVAAQKLKIYPAEDSFVRDTAASTNFNSVQWKGNLRVGYEASFGKDRSYLKFNLTGAADKTINSVKFSIFKLGVHDNPRLKLYTTSNSWQESTITWNNKPAEVTFISGLDVSSQERAEFDVTSQLVSGETISQQTASYVLIEDGEDGFFNSYSKDFTTGVQGDEVFWPYLEIDYNGQGCNTDADSNCDGCVQMGELLPYITQWKQGSVTMSDLLASITKWKTGEGC